jgi:hypothetical protein
MTALRDALRDTRRGENPARYLRVAALGIASVVPFVVALLHTASSSAWRDDLPILRGLSGMAAGRQGFVWPLVTQASQLLPLGSLHFRAALSAAIILGACGLAIFLVTSEILESGQEAPRLNDALSTIAALMATLGFTGQMEGTVGGGGAAALLLALLVVFLRPAESLSSPGRALLAGLLWGALFAESATTGVALLAAVTISLFVTSAKPSRATLSWALAGATATFLILIAPLYVRSLSPARYLDVGRIVSVGTAPFESSARPLGGIGLLRREVGALALVLAAGGGVAGLGRSRLRGLALPLVLMVALDALASLREGRWISAEQLVVLHFFALASLSIGVAIGVQTIAGGMIELSLPMAKGAAVFLVMTDLTLAAAAAEDADFRVDRRALRGAEAFTDEAFERLPPGAAVLVRSSPLALRLWSARMIFGMRPDVIVVPLPILGESRLTMGLLQREPALQQTLRDVSLDGRPGEEALTILADARPVLTELDPGWDRRVVSHLVADHFWLRFAPEPLGPSDRRAAFADLRARFDRVWKTSLGAESWDTEPRPDPATSVALQSRLADAATEAAMLGDREEAIALLRRLGEVTNGDRFVTELTQRLAASKTGAIDVRGLLH